ncbi:MAG: MFS transporter [Chloroflexota bacterium]
MVGWQRGSFAAVEARLRWNLSFDLTAAVGIGATTALVGALLPTIARQNGLQPLELAMLAAAPFLANLLGIFAGRLGPRSPRQLGLLRAAGAGLLLALLAPLPASPLVIIVAVGFWMSLSFGGPFHLRLWGAMYPPRLRGRMVGLLGMGRAAAAATAALGAGLIADRLGGLTAVALGGTVGLACSLAYLGIRTPVQDEVRAFSARASLRAIRERPLLRKLVLAQAFYGGGLIAASPLYALVYVDRLGLPLSAVGVLGILTAVATTAAFVAWGVVADRFGSSVVMAAGTVFGLGSIVTYVIAQDVAVLWVGAIAGGIASASIDLGISSFISDRTPIERRAAASAGLNAITGARGILVPFALSGLVQAGVVDVTGGLALCAIASAVGVGLYARLRLAARRADAHATQSTPDQPARAVAQQAPSSIFPVPGISEESAVT